MDAGRGNAKLCSTVETSISKVLKKLKLGQVKDAGRHLSLSLYWKASMSVYHKGTHSHACCCTPHRSYGTGPTKMSADTWTENKNMAHILNGMFSNTKTWHLRKVDGPQNHWVKQISQAKKEKYIFPLICKTRLKGVCASMSACMCVSYLCHGTRKGITGEEEGYISTRQNSLWAQRESDRRAVGEEDR